MTAHASKYCRMLRRKRNVKKMSGFLIRVERPTPRTKGLLITAAAALFPENLICIGGVEDEVNLEGQRASTWKPRSGRWFKAG